MTTRRSRAAETQRTYTVELPAGMELLTSNRRLHHMARYRLSRIIKEAAWGAAKAQRIPTLGSVEITVELRFPDRRRRDPHNWQDSAKAAIDGLVTARVLLDDDQEHVRKVSFIGELWPGTPQVQMLLHITEVDPTLLRAAGYGDPQDTT